MQRFSLQGMPSREFSWLGKHYLSPLLELLLGYLKTERKHYLYVYLDERHRYLPFDATPDDRAAFFVETLQKEKKLLREQLNMEGVPESDFEEIWDSVHNNLVSKRTLKPISLLAVGDCLMNEIRVFLHHSCWDRGVDLDTRFLYFSAPQKTELSADNVIAFIRENAIDLIALSFFSFRGLPLYCTLIEKTERFTDGEIRASVMNLAEFMKGFISQIREVTETPLLLHTACGLPLRKERKYLPFLSALSRKQRQALELLNKEAEDLAAATRNVFLINEGMIAESNGYRKCSQQILSRRTFNGAEFHTSYFGNYVAEHYRDIVVSYQRLHKTKVLLVDFDNTLWEGVMADGPVRHKIDVQELLKEVKEAGILLAGVSKNDPKNIRWNEMVLQPSDFVALKISWNMKAQSIREVAEELNLGIDSFALIDDSPAERELVNNSFPGLQTFDALDPKTWKSVRRMLQFPNTSDTDEARHRTAMYKAQSQRKQVMMTQYDYPSLMKMLALKVRYGQGKKKNLDRITELINRTNQFNTTTIRYSKAELKGLLESEKHGVYIFELADKFGDLGIVGAVIIERQDNTAIFDSFVMSCRAMGFGLEQLMLLLVLEAEKGATRFIGRFVQTEKNTPSRDIFSARGFSPLSETEWINEDSRLWPSRPEWFSTERI
jgi:FkbH-like protein